MARKFDNWLRAYVQHTRYSESPDNFHFWTGVATVAGALRRRVWIDERIFQWTPNFYIILVGPPGVAQKSTSIRQGLKLLEEVPGINFGPQSMTWQALTESLSRATEGFMINGNNEIMSCLTISVSELGTFLDAKNDELVSTLIAMWDGQQETWRRETKTQGNTEIKNPWLNVIGCTTPAWIRTNMPTNMIGGGLTSRIIFVYGNKKRQLVAFPSKMVTAADYKKEEEHLIHDLREISELAGEYRRTPDADLWGEAWYKRINTQRPAHMESDRFDGYISRKQTHLYKIAMVFAAAKRNDLSITVEDCVEADAALTGIEFDMLNVFNAIGVAPGAVVAEEILNIIRNARKIDYQRLWKLASRTMEFKTFADAMKGLHEAGYYKVLLVDNVRHIIFNGPSAGQSLDRLPVSLEDEPDEDTDDLPSHPEE